MVRVASYFGMSLAAFVFWQSMEKVHVWIALHQDEKKERLEREAEIKRVREELLKQNNYKEALGSNGDVSEMCQRCLYNYQTQSSSYDSPYSMWYSAAALQDSYAARAKRDLD